MSCAKKARPDPLLRAASVPQLATLVKRVFAEVYSQRVSQRVFAACRSHGVLARARRAMIEDSLGLGTNGFGPNPISPSAPVVTGSYARSTRRKDVPSKKLHKNSGLIH
jgi:hypothetical protein